MEPVEEFMNKFFYFVLCITVAASSGNAQNHSLALDQVIDLVRNQNLELKALSRDIEAHEGALVQSSLRLNPEIEIESVGGDEVERSVLFQQTLRTSGKRRKSIELATLRRDNAKIKYDVLLLQVIETTKIAFTELLANERTVALLKQRVAVAMEFLTAAERKVEAGGISPAELARARVFLAGSRLDLLREERLTESKLQGLASFWGGNWYDYESVNGSLDTQLVSLQKMKLESYVEQAPEVILAGSEIEIRESILALEKAMRTPDISFGGGIKRVDQARSAPTLSLSVPLPIFNRNQGAISEAAARQLQALEEKRFVQNQISSELHVLTVRLQSAYESAVTLRDQIIPDAQAATTTIREGYLLGKFNYLEVVDAQNILFDSQVALVATLTEYQMAGAEVEGLLGISIQSIIENSVQGKLRNE